MKPLDPEEHTYLRTSFLDRVAHELRGPAGVIDGAVQELEAALGPSAQEHRVLLDMMRRGVRRIVRTADRLQQTGTCERDTLDLSKQRCDLTELVRRSVAEAAATEGRKKIQVEIETPPVHSYAEVDERWMGVAVYEIASNSIRHARESVRVVIEQPAEGLSISFIDDNRNTGEFAPMRFKQPREARGLGLALAIVRDVVEAHGGRLVIERSTGPNDDAQKTRVRIELPQRMQASIAPAAEVSVAAPARH
ncbi:MAG TPA: HAMP domain-containing sensor histidine kinase [Polyangiales bacterium]|nr:HAMP domain-containing sensor histidine kinase [Polyangiales bacterium]